MARLSRRRAGRLRLVFLIMQVIMLIMVGSGLAGCGSDDERHDEHAGPDAATAPAGDELVIVDPWVRATAGEAEMMSATEPAMDMGGHDTGSSLVSGAFMVIENPTAQAERLVSAGADFAGQVEIHETIVQNDVMQMRPVDGIDIPAGGRAELKPGGYHIMLLDLERDLMPGETVTLVLRFASGRELTVEAPVRPLGM